MVKIYVVDNGGQWTHREWRTLKYLDVETKIVPNTISFDILKKEDINGLVLSGGAPRIGLKGCLGNTDEILEKADFPILGICAGHQYMARFFDGEVKPAENPEYGKLNWKLLRKTICLKMSLKNLLCGNHIMMKLLYYQKILYILLQVKIVRYKP